MPLTKPAGVYRPRHPERTVVYRLFEEHFERYVREYEERYEARVASRGWEVSRAWGRPLGGRPVGLRRWNDLSTCRLYRSLRNRHIPAGFHA